MESKRFTSTSSNRRFTNSTDSAMPRYASKITISELAQQSQSLTPLKRKVTIPYILVMIILMIFVLAAAVIPVCIIVYGNASSIISDLALQITETVVNKLGSELEDQFNNIAGTTITWMAMPLLSNMMTTVTNGLALQPTTNLLSYAFLNNTQGIGELVCHQASNLTGKVPANNNNKAYPNTTLYGVSLPNNLRVMDYTTGDDIYEGTFDTTTGVSTFPIRKAGFTPEVIGTKGAIFLITQTGCVPFWKAEIVGVPRFTFALCAPPVSSLGNRAPFACGSSLIINTTVGPTFVSLTPTVNSRIFMVTKDSRLVSSNKPSVSVFDDSLTNFRSVLNVTDIVIQGVSRAILSKYNNWASIPLTPSDHSDVSSYFQTMDVANDQWIVRIRTLSLKHTSDTFYLVVAIPRSDYFESVDRSLNTGIIVSAVISVAGCALAVLLVIAMVLPMKRMTESMMQVTRFDFSAFEGGVTQRTSTFSELRRLQETFETMVVAFATSIKQNREMSFRNNNRNALSSGTLLQ